MSESRRSRSGEIRLKEGETLRAYLGIDSGSTNTKFVLMNEEEEISA